MNTSVEVELDRWGERGKARAENLEDGSTIVLGFRSDGNNKIVFDRTIFLGKFAFRAFVTEYRGETFLVRASMAIVKNGKKKRTTKWGSTPLRERPLKPFYNDIGEVIWTLDRSGVFSDFPEKWNDYWANNFIKETLDLLRSPEIPKHYELHGDTSDEDTF